MDEDRETDTETFVTDLLSRVLMICGSLMAVINGLIPPLGAMIYGKLTDELVIRRNRNCTLNESVTRIILENLVAYEVLEPKMNGTNVTMTNSIDITVNETGVRVEVIGLDGSRLNERFLANTSTIWLNGTALNGTELIGVDLRGTNVTKTETKKNRGHDGKKSGRKKGDDSEGDINQKNHHIQEVDIDVGNSSTNRALITCLSEDVNRRLQEKRVTQNSLENGYFERFRRKRDVAFLDTALHHKLSDSRLVPQSLIGDNSRNNAGIITYFTGSEFPESHKNMIEDEREKENSETQLTHNSTRVSNVIKIGKEQSIEKLFPPTPKPVILPPTKNVSYILRNVTKSCRWYESNIEENMRKYALYYVYAAFATLAFAYGQTVLWNIASEIGVRNLSENLTDTVLHKDPGFYDTKISEGVPNFEGITDPLEAIGQKELDALSGGLGGEIAYMIQSVSNVMSGFLVSFIENWKITLVMMFAAPVLGIVQGIADKVERFVMQQKEELMNRAKGMAKKSLGSIKTVTAYAGEKMEKTRYSSKLETSANLDKLKSLISAIEKGLTTVLAFGFLGLGFWYSSTLLPGGSVTPGAIMTIFMAIIAGVMQMAGTGEQIEDIGDARSALSSLMGITESKHDPFDQAISQLDTVLGKLEVFNVYFHYPSRPEHQILKSINVTVEEGQTVALLGGKGCGKSALMKLLQKIYEPQTGKVRLDGQDIHFLDRRWFRRQVGIVHKEPEFFFTSVAENIAYGREGSSMEEVEQAAKDAGADGFIKALPHGYETILDDSGSPLTAYQKHLLALARALIRKPRILLWEEDLSFMDSAALDVLIGHLDQARQRRTTVISTSHVSIARIADVIVVLHDGEIIEQGTPTELIMSGEAFRYLATLQYFESQSIHQEMLLKTAPLSGSLTTVEDGYEAMESCQLDLEEARKQTEDQLKGFMGKIRQTVQDKLNEGEAAYKMIRMQLQDLPLLLAGALGAAITGMIAPGLSFLFGEIQKFMNDPLRVSREGPFWASMFVVLGIVVGFGGTMEKFMLGYATEKLRTRLQEMAFDTTVNKNSVPHIPGATGGFSFPGIGGQLPGIPRIPAGIQPPGTTDLPTGIESPDGLPPAITGIQTGIKSPDGELNVIKSPDGIPGIPGKPTDITLNIPSSQELAKVSMGAVSLQSLPGMTEGIPGSRFLRSVEGGINEAMFSGSGLGGVRAMVAGTGAISATNEHQQEQSLPGSTLVPTGANYQLDCIPPTGITQGIGVPQQQEMRLPLNLPNSDLLVLPDPQKQADQLIEQVEKDLEAALHNSIGKYLGPKVQESISSVSTLGMALYNGWKMTLVVLAGLPVIALANRIQQNEADAIVEPEGVEALMKTSFKKMETISALGLENKFAKQYKDAIFEKYEHALKKTLASGFAFALGQAMVFFIYAGALRFGCYLISINDMTPIQVLGVLMTVLFGSFATSSTRAPTHASEDNDDSLNRLFDDTVADAKDLAGDKMDEVKGDLNFEHVELRDPLHKGPPLMSQLSIKVSGGQTLAVVPLDEGKLNPFELLVERFYDPDKGGLFLDGANLHSLNLSWLRSQIAVVSHCCFMPRYSIADNIAYGNHHRAWALTRREIEDAAYSAHAHEFILELTKGYDTVCEEDEVMVSESQKLRIVIARAIIRGSPIIVLEELQQEEEAVTEATSILCRNKTCLIFTRRRQTVEAADQIVLLYRGHIVEQGTPQELRGLRRLYHLLTDLETED